MRQLRCIEHLIHWRNIQTFVAAVTIIAAAPGKASDPLTAMADRLRAQCDAIARDDYRSGMIFNPKGEQTEFVRSSCFQSLAQSLRDESLCREATERKSWLFDGSAISPARCRTAVHNQIAHDQDQARKVPPIQRVTGLSIVRNGNGRDFAALVQTSGGLAHAYRLTLTATGMNAACYLLMDQTQPLSGENSEISLWLPRVKLPPEFLQTDTGRNVLLEMQLELIPQSLQERSVFRYLSPNRASMFSLRTSAFIAQRAGRQRKGRFRRIQPAPIPDCDAPLPGCA